VAKKMGGSRPGAGRPRSVGGKRSVGLGVVLGDDLARDLDKSAKEFGITKGELIRRLAKQGLLEKNQPVTLRTLGGKRGKGKSE
jgi:hypothetical protein